MGVYMVYLYTKYHVEYFTYNSYTITYQKIHENYGATQKKFWRALLNIKSYLAHNF